MSKANFFNFFILSLIVLILSSCTNYKQVLCPDYRKNKKIAYSHNIKSKHNKFSRNAYFKLLFKKNKVDLISILEEKDENSMLSNNFHTLPYNNTGSKILSKEQKIIPDTITEKHKPLIPNESIIADTSIKKIVKKNKIFTNKKDKSTNQEKNLNDDKQMDKGLKLALISLGLCLAAIGFGLIGSIVNLTFTIGLFMTLGIVSAFLSFIIGAIAISNLNKNPDQKGHIFAGLGYTFGLVGSIIITAITLIMLFISLTDSYDDIY